MESINTRSFCFHDDGQMAGVDHNDPCTLAMQREDAELDARELRAIPPDALRTILRLIIPAENSQVRWKVAVMRLATLAHLAGLDTVGNLSQTELARELGCTRGLVSHYAVRLADLLGESQPRGGRTHAVREAYRKRALKVHRAKSRTMAAEAPGLAVAACA